MTHLRIFIRRIGHLLLAATILASLSLAQDQTLRTQDSTSAGQPSQAACAAAASSGRALPEGCSQNDITPGTSTRQQQIENVPIQSPQLSSERPEAPERGTIAPVNPSQRKKVEVPLRPQTEFEQIVADTVGRTIPLFGQSLFAQPPSTFAPTDRTQVPADYVIGPDDELQIRIWGQLNADLRVVVDRSGQIYIPRVGQISVAGVHYSDLDQRLKNEILKTFRNFNLTVNIGRIRSIQVYVAGQARYPGTYNISSLSSLVNAVFASGGPTPQGSLRDVQVQRDGKTITHMDFYDLLVKGDKSKDIHLQSGDLLYFPPVGPLAAIAGSVNTPAIYEVKPDSSLSDLIEIAGGLSTVADSSKVTVERLGDHQLRSVLEFPLDAQSRALPLRSGDIVRVFSIVPRFTDSVTLRGNVVNPGRYPWKPGMKVRDLIPDAQTLLTRSYWLSRAEMTNGRSTEYPIRPRLTPKSRFPSPTGIFAPDDDEQIAYSERWEVKPEQPNVQSGRGEIKDERDRQKARVNAETLTADLHRASPEINWSYAIIQRVNPVDLSVKLLSFDLGKAVLEGDPANNLELQSDDIITVFSQTDVSVPQSMRARYVRLEGEVVRAGVYKVEEGELLRDVIKRAGGVTPDAYIYGTQMTRESARLAQQQSIDELARNLEVEARLSVVSAAARGNSEDAQAITARQASQEAVIAQLKNARATGRVVLTLKPTANSIDAYPPIAMEDNDRVVIPHLPATVSVVGMVYNPGSFVFNPHTKTGEYLKLAGRGKPNADMRHAFVLRADGTVVASTSVNGMFSGDRFDSMRLHPGDEIVVPTKIPTGAFVRGLRDWSQIASQLALTGAALAVIH
jgi:protein involved in polysaccharide export with SLBB domain